MDTKRGFKGHADPPSKIKELIENGTQEKSVTWMEREIHSGEVPHAKAVAKYFEKPCAKSKFTILSTTVEFLCTGVVSGIDITY
ncbi:hypothetical protein YC2023_020226 [Brassica napus]